MLGSDGKWKLDLGAGAQGATNDPHSSRKEQSQKGDVNP